MKKITSILYLFFFVFILAACGDTQEQEVNKENETINNQETKTENPPVVEEKKTPSEILIGGSWNNPNAIRSEDVIFNADGKMIWRSGTDEGESTWEVKGEDVLNFYGQDYKIVEISETKLVVAEENGTQTTYERNESNSETTNCNPKFQVEGINDAKGEYKNKNESWTIHFAEDKFIIFYTKDGKQEDAIAIKEIEKLSNCEFKIAMVGIQGEIVPTWVLKYNEDKKYYDLHTRSYDANTDTWSDTIFEGSEDNG